MLKINLILIFFLLNRSVRHQSYCTIEFFYKTTQLNKKGEATFTCRYGSGSYINKGIFCPARAKGKDFDVNGQLRADNIHLTENHNTSCDAMYGLIDNFDVNQIKEIDSISRDNRMMTRQNEFDKLKEQYELRIINVETKNTELKKEINTINENYNFAIKIIKEESDAKFRQSKELERQNTKLIDDKIKRLEKENTKRYDLLIKQLRKENEDKIKELKTELKQKNTKLIEDKIKN